MKIVATYKIRGGSWGYANSKDDPNDILTGYYRRSTGEWDVWNGPGRGDTKYIVNDGINVILEDSILVGDVQRGRSAAGCMVEGDTLEYYMSLSNIAETLHAVIDGTIAVKDGKLFGLWTLRKQGDTVSLTPYRGKVPS